MMEAAEEFLKYVDQNDSILVFLKKDKNDSILAKGVGYKHSELSRGGLLEA